MARFQRGIHGRQVSCLPVIKCMLKYDLIRGKGLCLNENLRLQLLKEFNLSEEKKFGSKGTFNYKRHTKITSIRIILIYLL